jgi:hypothetical protein
MGHLRHLLATRRLPPHAVAAYLNSLYPGTPPIVALVPTPLPTPARAIAPLLVDEAAEEDLIRVRAVGVGGQEEGGGCVVA